MPLSLPKRNPDLLYRVERSIERARQAAGLTPGDVHRLGGTGIEAVAAAAAANETHARFGAGLESITNPEQRAVFEQAFSDSAQLFGRLNATVPTPEQCSDAGVNFSELAAKYQAEKLAGHEPEIVLAPCGLSSEMWLELFQNLENDSGVNGDGRIKNGGLYINSDVQAAWSQLNGLPNGAPLVDVDALATTSWRPGVVLDLNWTFRIISGNDRPTDTSIDHDGRKSENEPKRAVAHPTIAEYLTLQAQQLHGHNQPVDASTWTWLQGTFEGGSRAPYGDWIPVTGQVRLLWDDVGDRNDYLGVRPPVW